MAKQCGSKYSHIVEHLSLLLFQKSVFRLKLYNQPCISDIMSLQIIRAHSSTAYLASKYSSLQRSGIMISPKIMMMGK